MNEITIIIADDHPIVREGLRGLLGQHQDIVVSGEADSITSALEHIRKEQPDAVIIDPMTNLLSVGTQVDVRAMLVRLIDLLKVIYGK